MILVDANVIIAYQRTADPKIAGLFRTLPVAICGVTRAEVLHGARDPAERLKLLVILNAFQPGSIPDAICDNVGDNLATLRGLGFTFPFPDVILATLAISNDLEVWTRDQQFHFIQTALPKLRLFQEAP